MRNPIVLALVALSSVIALTPGGAAADKFAGEFMALGGGARALGMGGAFCAVAGDASTVFWNPAGVSGFESRQALFMHSERFGDLVNYNFGAFAMPTTLLGADREAALGFALIHLGVDDIIITNQLQYRELNGVPGFQGGEDELMYDEASLPRESSNDFALMGTFAMRTNYGRVGGTLKLIYTDTVTGVTSTGIGLDLGYLRRDFMFPRFDVGVKLQDITGTYLSWSSGKNEFIAPSVKVGVAYLVSSARLKGALRMTADGDFFFEDRRGASQYWVGSLSTDLHLGAELIFQEKVMVRGGFDAGNPTAGAGFRFAAFGFDYAYLHHDDFESTHRVSGLINF